MWYILLYMMEYYSAIRKDVLPFATWMDLENIMLREISQTEKDKNHIISLICGYKTESKKGKNSTNAQR